MVMRIGLTVGIDALQRDLEFRAHSLDGQTISLANDRADDDFLKIR